MDQRPDRARDPHIDHPPDEDAVRAIEMRLFEKAGKAGLRIAQHPSAMDGPLPVASRKARFSRRPAGAMRSEEHTSELQSLMRISYAVFCLNKKNTTTPTSHEGTE